MSGGGRLLDILSSRMLPDIYDFGKILKNILIFQVPTAVFRKIIFYSSAISVE